MNQTKNDLGLTPIRDVAPRSTYSFLTTALRRLDRIDPGTHRRIKAFAWPPPAM